MNIDNPFLEFLEGGTWICLYGFKIIIKDDSCKEEVITSMNREKVNTIILLITLLTLFIVLNDGCHELIKHLLHQLLIIIWYIAYVIYQYLSDVRFNLQQFEERQTSITELYHTLSWWPGFFHVYMLYYIDELVNYFSVLYSKEHVLRS